MSKKFKKGQILIVDKNYAGSCSCNKLKVGTVVEVTRDEEDTIYNRVLVRLHTEGAINHAPRNILRPTKGLIEWRKAWKKFEKATSLSYAILD